jgi:hypothetical protein
VPIKDPTITTTPGFARIERRNSSDADPSRQKNGNR